MAMVGGDVLDGTGMAGLIGKKVVESFPEVRLDDPYTRRYFNAIAAAVVEYIQANAEVQTSVSTSSTVDRKSVV